MTAGGRACAVDGLDFDFAPGACASSMIWSALDCDFGFGDGPFSVNLKREAVINLKMRTFTKGYYKHSLSTISVTIISKIVFHKKQTNISQPLKGEIH